MKNLSDDLLIIERDKFQHYLDLVGVMIVVLDREGNVSLINKWSCNILGYGKDEIIGKNWFDNFLPASIKDSVRSIFNQTLSGEIESVMLPKSQDIFSPQKR
ncbi:MAG: PAS domain S-box protein [Nitrospirae bacterium]|nr:PAS domain S-box protein [Nitrospirota bacterium]